MCAPCFQVIGKNYRCLLDKLQLFEGREQFFRQKKSLRIFFMQTIFIYLVSFGCTGSSGELSPAVAGGGDSLAAQHGL